MTPTLPVTFRYHTGIAEDLFANVEATLEGSWDEQGSYADTWRRQPMENVAGEDGDWCFRAVVGLDQREVGREFHWGVRFRRPDGSTVWAIPTEESRHDSRAQHRRFRLEGGPEQSVHYRLTNTRFLGANTCRTPAGDWRTRFRVWAPNAKAVDLVFCPIWYARDPDRRPRGMDDPAPREHLAGGYLDDAAVPEAPIAMIRRSDGIWESPADHPELADPGRVNHRLYYYRITRADGSQRYRTDLYSRCQSGYGAVDPAHGDWDGRLADLAGRVSASVFVDPDTVVRRLDVPVWPEPASDYVSAETFWADEFTDRPLPRRVEDLIIYELHLGALGFGEDRPGNLQDAIELLDHLVGLGINAVELLPLSEFAGGAYDWGYATSHYFAIEYGGGGRDHFKHFVKACHRRGIAVIMDVVYNHYDHHAERAERHYDAPDVDRDIYYWYEGDSSDYAYLQHSGNPYWRDNWQRGGYLDNLSTGDAPAYHREIVRQMFVSSAVALAVEFHIDGFRVDQTTSIHGYNKVRATGQTASHANIFGAKLLRELGRTLRLVRPELILMAEDHSDWDQVTLPVDDGGMGFDARWFSDYYHHLIGDTHSGDKANLLRAAAADFGGGRALAMDWFAGVLWASQFQKIVYNESHDEAGNSTGPYYDPTWQPGDEESKRHTSERTINVAAGAAPLVGATRKYAEARCRFAWGVTVLSAGTPMFLFGEEVGAEKRFKYGTVASQREDIHGLRQGSGAFLYQFYADVNRLRLASPALCGRRIDIVHVNNEGRVIAFRRWDEHEAYLVVASLADVPYANGYVIRNDRLEAGDWFQVLSSDAASYGGDGVGANGARIPCDGASITVPAVPFAGLVVLKLG
ncbi:MAG: alpha-amylase family glycosyl hydrolase [Cyanobacteria bacterium J06638_7]